MEKENTSIRLNRIMAERGLRQIDILNLTVPYCKKYNVKMNKSDISQYCSGKTEPMQDKLFVLGAALGVNEAWLMGYNVPMERNDYEDQTILTREAMLEEIENILSEEKYILFCEDYYSDHFDIKKNHGQTVASFYDYELLPEYEKLRKSGNVSADSIINLKTSDINPHEMEHIKKYRLLDPEGQAHVDTVLGWETDRMNALHKLRDRPAAMRIYTYLHKIAAAGTGFYFEDIPTDTIEAPFCENADFIIGVNGDSMEPTYNDGDLVYVEKCQVVHTGDVGIFIVNNELFIKEAGEDGLISHNSKYDPIPGDENMLCVGKVLGKVNTD